MTRLVLFLIGVVTLAAGLSWLADRPGSLVLTWQGYDIETTVFRAAVLLAFLIGLSVFAVSILRQIWASPAAVGRFFNRRREQRGLEALSSGLIAIGSGDRALATRYAVQARKALPNEPLTHLLRAQAAQLSGDRSTSRRIFEAMLSSPDTEQLGLRGLFLEAEREGEREAARQFAARALSLNPKLAWSFDALFDLQCKASDWAGALETLTIGRRHGHIEKPDSDRRRAVLLTAQAQALEEENGQKAQDLAIEAHGLAPDLIPAAVISGRQLASRGNTARAAKIVERTWKRSPHPDLAVVHAFARPGDSPRDRLERIRRLARSTPHSAEGPIAHAQAALEAREFQEARTALEPLLDGRLSQRVCTLMARIEDGERQNAGGVREWLARAVNAPRDPAWTADGIVAEQWAAISPVTGALDAFQWKVPHEAEPGSLSARALEKLDELVPLVSGPARRQPAHRDAVDVADDDEPVAQAAKADAMPKARAEPAASQAGPVPGSPASRSEASIKVEIAKPANGNGAHRMPAADATATAAATAAPVRQPVEVTGRSPKPEGAPAVTADAWDGDPPTRPIGGTQYAASGDRGRNGSASHGGATLAAAPARAPGSSMFVPPRAPDDPGLDDEEPAKAPPDLPTGRTKRV